MWMNDTCLLVWIDALDKTEACFDDFTHLRVSFFCHCQCSVAILMELEKTKQSNYIYKKLTAQIIVLDNHTREDFQGSPFE